MAADRRYRGGRRAKSRITLWGILRVLPEPGGGGAAKRDLSRELRPGSPLDRSVAAGRNPAEREVL
ncbi:hypothetical protein MKFW12EY_39550 [Methylomonas koyamae]|nr:hypothetical protein MKFW12EY_39550 [Methylomonas koyamae]